MNRKAITRLLVLSLAATPAAFAGDGHTLHGVGAVNSSMGGAGVALGIDTIGGLLLNPALATQQDGSHFAFSAEYNQAKAESVALNENLTRKGCNSVETASIKRSP